MWQWRSATWQDRPLPYLAWSRKWLCSTTFCNWEPLLKDSEAEDSGIIAFKRQAVVRPFQEDTVEAFSIAIHVLCVAEPPKKPKGYLEEFDLKQYIWQMVLEKNITFQRQYVSLLFMIGKCAINTNSSDYHNNCFIIIIKRINKYKNKTMYRYRKIIHLFISVF